MVTKITMENVQAQKIVVGDVILFRERKLVVLGIPTFRTNGVIAFLCVEEEAYLDWQIDKVMELAVTPKFILSRIGHYDVRQIRQNLTIQELFADMAVRNHSSGTPPEVGTGLLTTTPVEGLIPVQFSVMDPEYDEQDQHLLDELHAADGFSEGLWKLAPAPKPIVVPVRAPSPVREVIRPRQTAYWYENLLSVVAGVRFAH